MTGVLVILISFMVFEIYRSGVQAFKDYVGWSVFHRRYYLNTWHWKLVKKLKRKFSKYRCEVCGQSWGLDLHHKTYDHIWWEFFFLNDLAWLCRKHHLMADKERHEAIAKKFW